MKPLNAFTCGTVYRALLTVILTLALFAGNAAAQCKGKKVYIQLPDGWGTNVYILWNGKFERMTTTTEGAWTTFTFPTTLQNDDANSANRAEMIITDYDDYYNNAGTTHYITTRDIGSSKNLPENTASRRFSCNDFSSPATYISFNPSTPSKPNISALPPDAKYLYFLPPDAPEWVSGKSYVYNGTSTEAMEPAPGMCGWYRIVYFNRAAPATAQFYLGSSGTKKVGSLGEDGYIDLAAKFASMGNDVYFVADEEEWYPMDPGISDGSRCGYNLAAFIYDTDPSVHPDFSCGVYQDEDNCTEAPANTNKKTKCTGVRKGLVKPNLDPVTKKIEYSGVDPQGCWTSRSWFDTAFKSSPGVNVTHCFDLPFKQEQNGRFEFDSDKWLNADGSLIGGFFPEMLHNAPTDPSCPSCNTKRTAEVFTPMHEKLTVEQFDSYVSKEGDFMNGNTPELSAMLPGATENTVWDWGARDKLRWYLHGATSILGNAKSKANQHFCFESHAEFVYQKGQVFDFRGDDAIWIFIDNRLSVDLGGAHMAAPARVNLDTMGLTEGVTYPIDIFFCDMRTTQSNVRISTNMYITQKSNFYQDPGDEQNVMCVATSGDNDCASKMAGGSTTSSGTACGDKLLKDYGLDFYMIDRGTADTIWLDPFRNPECRGTDRESFTCFDGIRIDRGTYSCGGSSQCKGNSEAISKVNYSGNVTVYVRLMKDGIPQGAKPLKIDEFKKEVHTRIVWGNVKSETGSYTALPKSPATGSQAVMAGVRVPIYVAVGGWDSPGFFTYDLDEGPGKNYSIRDLGLSDPGQPGKKLRVYDRDGKIVTGSKIPANGVDTLWVEGTYDMSEYEFRINVTMESNDAPDMLLTIYPPAIKFVQSDYSTNAGGKGYSELTEGATQPPYVGTPLTMYIVAYDPKTGDFCGTCNFALTDFSTTSNDSLNKHLIIQSNVYSTQGIVDGKATVNIAGLTEVLKSNGTASALALWEVSGPNKKETVATWEELEFRVPPVPVPVAVYIYDANGDGIADSIEIHYNKSFRTADGNIKENLPSLIGVLWDVAGKDTVWLKHPDYNAADLQNTNAVKGYYDNGTLFNNNLAYWGQYVKSEPGAAISENIIAVGGQNFSPKKGILTFSENASIISRAAFVEVGPFGEVFTYNISQSTIIDRIPPIVVKAIFNKGSGSCGKDATRACREKLIVELSEPIFADNLEDAMLTKNPFSYCFISQGNKCNDGRDRLSFVNESTLNWEKWELPGDYSESDLARSSLYKPSGGSNVPIAQGGAKGDNIVEITYDAYTLSDGNSTTRMPKGGDWVKIRNDGPVFRDLSGNDFNPKELGMRIEGENPSRKEPVHIGTLGPDLDPEARPIVTLEPPLWISPEGREEIKNNWFNNGKITEFLPLRETEGSDEAKIYYPGSAGTVYVMDVYGKAVDFIEKCKKSGCRTPDGKDLLNERTIVDHITLYAEVFYHTNLGNYVSESSKKNGTMAQVKCGDPIFKNEHGAGDCLQNRNRFYLAWDLKANNGRFVGTGAYVAVTNFWWDIEYMESDGQPVKFSESYDKNEDIQLYGVKRKK